MKMLLTNSTFEICSCGEDAEYFLRDDEEGTMTAICQHCVNLLEREEVNQTSDSEWVYITSLSDRWGNVENCICTWLINDSGDYCGEQAKSFVIATSDKDPEERRWTYDCLCEYHAYNGLLEPNRLYHENMRREA